MIFRQLQDGDSSTYTYLIADAKTRRALIIDPVIEQIDRDSRLIEEMGLSLAYILETHVHADHITSAGRLRIKYGAEIAVGKLTGLKCADILLDDGEELRLDSLTVRALSTPGHTNGCTSYYIGDRIFTGDTLLIRGCGRTDFQEGSSERLFKSVREKIFTLAEDTLVFPGHDYKGLSCSTVGEEKLHNPRLNMNKSLEDFKGIMENLKLAPPKKIAEAVPRNLLCGLES